MQPLPRIRRVKGWADILKNNVSCRTWHKLPMVRRFETFVVIWRDLVKWTHHWFSFGLQIHPRSCFAKKYSRWNLLLRVITLNWTLLTRNVDHTLLLVYLLIWNIKIFSDGENEAYITLGEENLNTQKLLRWCYQIANGMGYLAARKVETTLHKVGTLAGT